MRNFRNLVIWNKGIDIVKRIYYLCQSLPSSEGYGLKSQMQRAAVSIPSNIAEGCSRNSEIDFRRFLRIAIGSSFELETQLIIANELCYLNDNQFKQIIVILHEEQKQINSLIIKLKNSS